MPPSMGGHASGSSGAASKVAVVQSPQYVSSSGVVGGADVVQSPAYNPASPQYAAGEQIPLTSANRSKF